MVSQSTLSFPPSLLPSPSPPPPPPVPPMPSDPPRGAPDRGRHSHTVLFVRFRAPPRSSSPTSFPLPHSHQCRLTFQRRLRQTAASIRIPRHGGGMGRKPVDPPPPVDSSQGCTACWMFQVLVLVLFPKELPSGLRVIPPATRKGPHSPISCPRRLQDGPRWPPRCLQDGQDGLQDG